MDAIKRMGVSYGKLALSVSPEVIQVREVGVKAAAKALKLASVGELVRTSFGFKPKTDLTSFLAAFTEADPTLVLQAEDVLTSLLAGTTLAFEMEKSSAISGAIALAVSTASCGGLRNLVVFEGLGELAANTLANEQAKTIGAPAERRYSKASKSILDSITDIESKATQASFAVVGPSIVTVLKGLAEYAEANALAAAKNDNELLGYIGRLEEELRVYWWVVGGWSEDQNKPYSELPVIEAGIRAGIELSKKHSAPLGLFSAPALLDMVISRGREGAINPVTLVDAVKTMDLTWRRDKFGSIASGELAELLPVAFALGLSAESEDATDWIPRFERITKINPNTQMKPIDIGLQLYRELLTIEALDD